MTEMTELAAKKHFGYRRKYFIFFQGKNGNVMPFIKGLETLKLIDFDDKDTVVITFKYPFTNMREILLKITTFETNIS